MFLCSKCFSFYDIFRILAFCEIKICHIMSTKLNEITTNISTRKYFPRCPRKEYLCRYFVRLLREAILPSDILESQVHCRHIEFVADVSDLTPKRCVLSTSRVALILARGPESGGFPERLITS